MSNFSSNTEMLTCAAVGEAPDINCTWVCGVHFGKEAPWNRISDLSQYSRYFDLRLRSFPNGDLSFVEENISPCVTEGRNARKLVASVCDRELEASFRLDPRDEWLLCDPAEYCEAADEDDRDAVYLGPVEGDLLLDQVAEGLDCFVFDDKPDLAWSDEEECRAALGLEDED